MALLMAGCQGNAETAPAKNTQAVVDKAPQEQVGVEKGVPFSNGPSVPPEAIEGPSAPPPENGSAKAVTTNENIRITLPVKTE
jgi:hypothetical protein